MAIRTALACITAAAAMLCIDAAQAQSQVQIYGVLDLGIGRMANQDPGAPTTPVTAVRGAYNGGLQTSYIGFRGSEDLGGGMSAKFQMESFLRLDTGEAGRFNANPSTGADVFWGREIFVGLAGNFGEVRLGGNANPAWLASVQGSAMGANSRFSPHFRQIYNSGTRGRSLIDTEMVNSIRYVLPSLGSISGSVAVQAGEGRGSRYNTAAHLAYREGNLSLTVGLQQARHVPVPSLNAAAVDQELWLVGGGWNFGFMRVLLSWAEVNNGSSRSRLPQVGLTAPAGAGTLQFAAGRDTNRVVATGSQTRRESTSLGYIYPLSKRTDLYAFGMSEKFPVVGSGRNRGDSYLLGLRHGF